MMEEKSRGRSIETLSHDILERMGAGFHCELFKCSIEDAKEAILCATGYIDARFSRGNIEHPSDRSVSLLLKDPSKHISRGRNFVVDLSEGSISKYNDWAEEERAAVAVQNSEKPGWSFASLFRSTKSQTKTAAVYASKERWEKIIANQSEED